MPDNLTKTGRGNTVNVGAGVTLAGSIAGDNNIIEIGDAERLSRVSVKIFGNNNAIRIADHRYITGLTVMCGNSWKVNSARVEIGEGFSCGPGARFYLYDHQNELRIGSDNMFSNNITIRCADYPHLVFDRETGDYLGENHPVVIGDHVWVGENVYFTKSAGVASGCIVAACGVVGKAFDEENCVLAGNPARIVKTGIHWERNLTLLGKGSRYEESYRSKTTRKNWLE